MGLFLGVLIVVVLMLFLMNDPTDNTEVDSFWDDEE